MVGSPTNERIRPIQLKDGKLQLVHHQTKEL